MSKPKPRSPSKPRPAPAPERAPAIVRPRGPKAVRFSELSEREKAVFATPAGFATGYLGIGLYPKQQAILNACGPSGSWVTAVCCNEAGKTTRLIAPLILWHLTVFAAGTGIATSGSWTQVTSQLIPALKTHAAKFPRWDFNATNIVANGIERWTSFSTNNAGRAEGFHGNPEAPLLATIDEAKSVRDDIFKAIEDRCRPQRKAFLSSAGYATGEFFKSHTTNASLYKVFKITVDECPHIDRDEMRRIITKAGDGSYENGLNDPTIRSAYFAEFMQFVEGALLSFADIEECLAEAPQARPGERHVFCDFASGGAENVIAVRLGNKVWIQDAWRDRNTMSAVGRFVSNFAKLNKEIGLRAEEIEGDADGMGQPMVDAIAQAGWEIVPFHNNARPFEPDRFKNRSAEVWFTGAEKIQRKQVILPRDPELFSQLTNRKSKYESSGLRWLESKEELRKRGVASPDRADAVLGALSVIPAHVRTNLVGSPAPGPWDKDPDVPEGYGHEEMSVPEDVLRGFNAGG